MGKLTLYYPTQKPSRVFQKFGENLLDVYKEMGMKGHNGWDMYAPDGAPIRAAHDGRISYAGLDGSNGELVVIHTNEQFDYGDGQAYYKTMYGHLKRGNIFVTSGQQVKAGDLIALADNTGLSTGSHLHFGLKPVARGENDWVWWNIEQNNGYNGAIDPEPYFNGFHAEDAQKVLGYYQLLVKALAAFVNEFKKRR